MQEPGNPSKVVEDRAGRGLGRLRIVAVALLVGLASVPRAAAIQDDPPASTEETAARSELEKLQVRVGERVQAYKAASAEEREKLSFQRDLKELGDYVRRWQDRQPTYANAARIFLAREVLYEALGKDRDAEQVLQSVITEAADPYVAGMAAMHATEIAVAVGGSVGRLRQSRELYEARPDAEPQIVAALRSLEAGARLRVGAEFPDLAGPGLDGKERRLGSLGGKLSIVLFFNCSHEESKAALRAVVDQQAQLGSKGLRSFCVSLDVDRRILEEELAAQDRKGVSPDQQAVVFDGAGWESPLAASCGIQELPVLFLLGPDRVIRLRGLPLDQLPTVLRDALQQIESGK